ncbi:MAG: hypothetical protein U0271_38420 [Polyangiaceae bacterium]
MTIGPVVRIVFAKAPFAQNDVPTIAGTIGFSATWPVNQSSSGNLNPDASVNIHATLGTQLVVFDTQYVLWHQIMTPYTMELGARQRLLELGFPIATLGTGANRAVAMFEAGHGLLAGGFIGANQDSYYTRPQEVAWTAEADYQRLVGRFPPQG